MVHIYTGEGKGKTTAALGLAFRAAGHGKKTLFIQFMKKRKSGELVSAMLFPGLIEIEQYGREEFYVPEGGEPQAAGKTVKTSSDRALFESDAAKAFERAETALAGESHDIVVLDEVLNLVSLGIAGREQLAGLLSRHSGKKLEIVLTGRGAWQEIIDKADIVTEMKKIKHWYDNDCSREPVKGIEY